MAKTEEDLTGRRDEAVTGADFKSWLRDLSDGDDENLGPYAAIYELADDKRFGLNYSFEQYCRVINENVPPTHAEKLITILAKAEAEWRVDTEAKKEARSSLGLTTKSSDPTIPTAAAIRCGFVKRNGDECGWHVVPGSSRCEKHGGMLIDPEVRQSILMSAYTRIVEGTEVAVKALVDIAEGGRSEIARVQAAKEILDRAGLSPELRIAIRGEDSSDDRIYRLKQQLDQTRERLMESSIETTAAPEPESKEPDSSFETPELPFETEDASEPVEVLKGELVDYEPLTIDNMPPGLR